MFVIFLPKSILLVSCKKCVTPIRLLFTAAYCDKKVRDLNVYHFSVTKVFLLVLALQLLKFCSNMKKKLVDLCNNAEKYFIICSVAVKD